MNKLLLKLLLIAIGLTIVLIGCTKPLDPDRKDEDKLNPDRKDEDKLNPDRKDEADNKYEANIRKLTFKEKITTLSITIQITKVYDRGDNLTERIESTYNNDGLLTNSKSYNSADAPH